MAKTATAFLVDLTVWGSADGEAGDLLVKLDAGCAADAGAIASARIAERLAGRIESEIAINRITAA